ncbi:MAG TPA: N-methyl-D-aspartate receptor NMDAR2C subunit [Candidatus Woesebacteria bacterium]|nr:N-methyl-D-aspartate receptor NMDAR2C subunit [Candidatus Woesebacteria bacterium]
MDNSYLEQHWIKLCNSLPFGDIKLSRAIILKDLEHLYSHPQRGYHNLDNHIQHCLKEFDAVKHLAINPKALELAIWFHDAIYDTKIHGIEEMCADLAFSTCRTAHLSVGFSQKVSDLVLATRHIEEPLDIDAQLICDIDLSPLGLPQIDFDQNSVFIREEYGWVSNADFAKGRMNILKKYLDRRSLYITKYFQNKYGEQARQNLLRSMAELSRMLDT